LRVFPQVLKVVFAAVGDPGFCLGDGRNRNDDLIEMVPRSSRARNDLGATTTDTLQEGMTMSGSTDVTRAEWFIERSARPQRWERRLVRRDDHGAIVEMATVVGTIQQHTADSRWDWWRQTGQGEMSGTAHNREMARWAAEDLGLAEMDAGGVTLETNEVPAVAEAATDVEVDT